MDTPPQEVYINYVAMGETLNQARSGDLNYSD